MAADRRAYDSVNLGQALGARILGALNEQDLATVGRALAVDGERVQEADPETLRSIAHARAGALNLELAAQLFERQPRQPAFSDDPGAFADDIALITDGLAALCAAHGYETVQVHGDALSSPFDIPGALYLPAYSLQILFAYIDQGGLGPYVGSWAAPLGQGSSSTSLTNTSAHEWAGVPA